jgi:hypothetical protein
MAKEYVLIFLSKPFALEAPFFFESDRSASRGSCVTIIAVMLHIQPLVDRDLETNKRKNSNGVVNTPLQRQSYC